MLDRTMKAAVLNDYGQPLSLEDVSLDPPRANEVQLRIGATGVCHSDYHVIKGEWKYDLPMILALSDRVYCMESGAVIAEGTPADVRNNSLVIASYLGTDERAIQRSNA